VGGEDPETGRHDGEFFAVQVIEEVFGRLVTVTEFNSRLPWDGESRWVGSGVVEDGVVVCDMD
jgi:hypothetical protein